GAARVGGRRARRGGGGDAGGGEDGRGGGGGGPGGGGRRPPARGGRAPIGGGGGGPQKGGGRRGGGVGVARGGWRARRSRSHQRISRAVISYGVNMAYSQLLTYKYGPGTPIPNFSVTTDLAESFDQPDERTYVFKLRGGVKYQNLPPVNGRELVADDVIKSFE